MGWWDRLWHPAAPGVAEWPDTLERARELLDDCSLQEAERLLAPVGAAGARSPAERAMRAMARGMLGECCFHRGETGRAIRHAEAGLADADAETACALLGDLLEMHRYEGDRQAASRRAGDLAALLDRRGAGAQAERYRALAARLIGGEPPVRVLVDLAGERLEVEEVLRGREGSVRFVYERDRLTLRPARLLLDRGAALCRDGEFDEAVVAFDEASRADPQSPEADYEKGLALLHLGEYPAAEVALRLARERAPGWFLVSPAHDLAGMLVAGALDHDTFVAWHALEEGPLGPDRKQALVEATLPRAPRLALLHLHHGLSLKARGGILAEAAFRRGLTLVAGDADTRSRLLLGLASVLSRDEERRHLGQVATPGANLRAAAEARIVLAFDPAGGE